MAFGAIPLPLVIDPSAPLYVQHLVTDLNDALGRLASIVDITGWRKLVRQSADDSATIEFTLDGTFDCYMIEIVGLVPATDATALYLRVSTDEGTSWAAGGSDYSWHHVLADDTPLNTADGDATAAQVQLTDTVGSAAGRVASGSVLLFRPGEAALNAHQYKMAYTSDGGVVESTNGGFRYNTASAVDGVRFLMSSGNITSGTFTLYGLPK